MYTCNMTARTHKIYSKNGTKSVDFFLYVGVNNINLTR